MARSGQLTTRLIGNVGSEETKTFGLPEVRSAEASGDFRLFRAATNLLEVDEVENHSEEASTCFKDTYGFSGGCHLQGCSCPIPQHCYPKYRRGAKDMEQHLENVGVCGPKMWLLALMSIGAFIASVMTLMVVRSCLEREERTRELDRDTAILRSKAKRSRPGARQTAEAVD
eukprot:g18728.t1